MTGVFRNPPMGLSIPLKQLYPDKQQRVKRLPVLAVYEVCGLDIDGSAAVVVVCPLEPQMFVFLRDVLESQVHFGKENA